MTKSNIDNRERAFAQATEVLKAFGVNYTTEQIKAEVNFKPAKVIRVGSVYLSKEKLNELTRYYNR